MSDRTTLLSPLPWSWRPYDDDVPMDGLCDARDNELGFVWIASEDTAARTSTAVDSWSGTRLANIVLRSRAELEANLTAICAAMNGTAAEPPATPRPWRVIPGIGWKDERVLSIVGPSGHDDEVLCRHHDHQTEIDFAAIVAAVNERWP